MASPETISRTISHKKYEYYDIGNGSPVVVLLHGIAANKDQLLSLKDKIPVETRFILPDLPGHGNIALDGIENFEDTAKYIVDLIEELKLESVVVVGYSMGGLIALKLAEKYSEKPWLKGLVARASPILGVAGVSKEGRVLMSRVMNMNGGLYGVITRPVAIQFATVLGRVTMSEEEIAAMSEYPLESA